MKEPRWGHSHKAALRRLFELGSPSGCSYLDTTPEAIEAVRVKHFPNRVAKNFKRNFLKGASDFQKNLALTGVRAASANQEPSSEPPTEPNQEEDDILFPFYEDDFSEDSSFVPNVTEQEDIDTVLDDTIIPEQEEVVMEPKDLLQSSFERMSLRNSSVQHSMDMVNPHFYYDYREGEDRFVSYEFWVPSMKESNFEPKVSDDGNYLTLDVSIPLSFYDKDRIFSANTTVTANTHQATSFVKAVSDICDGHKWEDGDPPIKATKTQKVKLPFCCDLVLWEAQLNESYDTPDANQNTNGYIFADMYLVVKLKEKKKKEEKKTGGLRLIASPRLARARQQQQRPPVNPEQQQQANSQQHQQRQQQRQHQEQTETRANTTRRNNIPDEVSFDEQHYMDANQHQ